ncbi:MAG: hypothetical protein M1125_04615, partial [Candidatus Marsarchaeota archaeon]|nr:hypothetical protein [Candidatus Marsarchaeota archaeon]
MISVYAWAFLIIAIFVAFIFIISGPKPAVTYLPPVCSIQPLLPCISAGITTLNAARHIPIKFTLIFENELSTEMKFPANSINVTLTNIGSSGINTYNGACIPQMAASGTRVLCTVSVPGTLVPALGTDVAVSFKIKYYACTLHSCTGPYITTGTSTQTISPSYVPAFNVTLYDNPTSGRIVINGVTYSNNVTVPLSSGNYTLYAVAPAGYIFQAWSIATSSTSSLSQNDVEPTVLKLDGNASITATFATSTTTSSVYTTTPTTITFTTSSTTSTSTTTTSIPVTFYYLPIKIDNAQSVATPAPFQQEVQISESTYGNYIAYSGNLANFEFAYLNGTVIPAWIESNDSGTITAWLKLQNGIPANSAITIYLGFAPKTTNL